MQGTKNYWGTQICCTNSQIQYAVKKKKKCSNSFRSSMNASTISQQNRRRSKQNTHLLHWNMCTQTEPAEFLFTCLRRYPEVPVTKDQLRLTHYNPASSEEGASPRIKTTSLHRWISPSSAVCTHSQKPSPLRLGGGTRSIVGVWECEREWEEAGAECAQQWREQRISIPNAQMETVWRQWRGWNNHWLTKQMKHLGQRKLPLCFFKHRALTWCSSHAPLYWCPCPIHWEVPAKRSRSLTGAASLRIWSCGCSRKKGMRC